MPNLVAYIALFSWPVVVIMLFRRLPLPTALVWSVMGGYLFLPEQTGIDLPVLPSFDKVLIPSISAAIMCFLVARSKPVQRSASNRNPTLYGQNRTNAIAARSHARSVSGAAKGQPSARRLPHDRATMQSRKHGRVLVTATMGVILLSPFLTLAFNRDPVVAGPLRYIAGLRLYDAMSMALSAGIMLLPFLLARRHLASSEAHTTLLRALVWAGITYSLLILIEVRLSPQLNKWIYGFYSHSFAQHVRGGGFRPMVFVGHGLRVGIFIAMTCLAAIVLFRARNENQPALWLLATVWLLIILVLSKTTGALIIAILLLSLVATLKVRGQMIMAAILAGVVLLYPMFRGSGVVPVERIYALALSVSAERAASLKVRFDNENLLLARANQKPLLGWGGWGRSRVYDPETGKDISVTDGRWVIEMGNGGWVNYLAMFGLLVLPIFMLTLRRKQIELDLITSGLCVIMVANLVDLLPNSSLTPMTWLIAGALIGRFENGSAATSIAEARQPRHRSVRRDSQDV